MFSTAQLHMGSGASGKLVTAVKQQMTQAAGESDLAIIDGSPGIGCPVIASITGVDFVLVVTEPTVSGLHDLGRILDTANHFEVPCAVCVNRYDVSPEHTEKIARYCGDRSIPMIGKIPFDATVVEAVNGCRTIADYPESPAGQAILEIWARLGALL
jgi:MinD superfamily P-loop ATPase